MGHHALVLLFTGCIIDLMATLSAVVSVITLFYIGAIIYRLALFRASNQADITEVVSDQEARAVPR